MGRKQGQPAESVWRHRLAKFGKSTLKVTDFCRQEGVSVPSFYHWRKRLGEGERLPPARRSSARSTGKSQPRPFVPVSVLASPIAEVEFPNGVRIRVPATSVEALRVAITAGHEVCREVG